MNVSSYITAKAVKGQASEIQGRGLFATEPIPAGDIVAIKGGHIVDTATLHACGTIPHPSKTRKTKNGASQ